MAKAENPHGFSADSLPIHHSYDEDVDGRPVAWHFDRLVKDKSTAPFNEYFDNTVISLIKKLNIPPPFSILDMACGTGKLLKRIQEEFSHPANALCGVDLSRSMISIATSKNPRVLFEHTDIRTAYPEMKNAFDLVTCINAVHYLPTIDDVQSAYVNAFRLLKPGGHYVVVTGDHASTAGWQNMTEEELGAWIAKSRPPMDWSMPDKNGNPVFRLTFYPYLNEEHAQALNLTGFTDITTYRQYPPDKDIALHSPNVYNLLQNERVFTFMVARKPHLAEVNDSAPCQRS